MKVRIGVGDVPVLRDQAGANGQDAGSDLAGLVDDLEARRIDSVWLSDVVSSPHTVEPLIGLAFAAGRTSRLKLGTGVLVLPGRNPALVAAQLAALASIAPGRILPSFGLQPATAADRSMYPVPRGRRGDVFDECLTVIRALLSQESVDHHGEFFDFDGASVAPRPSRPLDLWLGGTLPVAMDRVGRLADGWLGAYVTPTEAATCRSQIIVAAERAGRAVEDDHYGTNLFLATEDHDLESAVATAAVCRRDFADPEQLVCHGWAGARDQLRRFIDAGLTKFVVRPVGAVRSRAEFLDRFADELLPLQT